MSYIYKKMIAIDNSFLQCVYNSFYNYEMFYISKLSCLRMFLGVCGWSRGWEYEDGPFIAIGDRMWQLPLL